MSTKLELVKEYVKAILDSETTGHDYYHALRVMKNAEQISNNKEVNTDLIKVCCLTHDLIDKKISKDIEKSLEELKQKLIDIGYETEETDIIIDIIQSVSYSKGFTPSSLEGKIVQDADRLDALGAIGIARTFAYGGKHNRMIYNPNKSDNSDSISHFYDKLLKLKGLMNTQIAKKIAEERTQYIREFLDRFFREW